MKDKVIYSTPRYILVRKMAKRRAVIVRVIEDCIVGALMFLGIVSASAMFGLLFRALGVA